MFVAFAYGSDSMIQSKLFKEFNKTATETESIMKRLIDLQD